MASKAKPTTGSLNNQFQLTAQNGFTLNLMSGGQLLVNLANSIVFEYSNHSVQMVTPNLTISFMQPLLARGLGADRHSDRYRFRSARFSTRSVRSPSFAVSFMSRS